MTANDKKFMKSAIKRAKAAAEIGEVPIGAVVVCDGKIISSGKNMREIKQNALLHAEISAIDRACKKIGAWRLNECELYVTLEPCPMCAGAIINSRIKRVVFGAYDLKAGAFGSVFNLNDFPLNHKCELLGGVLEQECADILSDFFKELRIKRKNNG
ncbi:tRNA adenosine(34) deaminase TadA [Eubacteriales bacterium OttesenSCG-928-G02]|nr:tRNA adenosine(34) deaminase TadA [Eubacteriales bacterium OttesenSCG-928-G02]